MGVTEPESPLAQGGLLKGTEGGNAGDSSLGPTHVN